MYYEEFLQKNNAVDFYDDYNYDPDYYDYYYDDYYY